MTTNKGRYHNDGEDDAKDRDYDPPHGIVDDLTTWSRDRMQRNADDNTGYDKGYFNSRGQADGAANKYDPPSGSDTREIYNNAWESSHEESKKGGCFLTTACVEYAGLPDDCHELRTLRWFRDVYLSTPSVGPSMIAAYYQTAPRIVLAIERSAMRAAYLDGVLNDVRSAVALINRGRYAEALDVYVGMVKTLQQRLLDMRD